MLGALCCPPPTSVLREDGDTPSSLSLSSCLSLSVQNQVLFRFHNSLWDLRISACSTQNPGDLEVSPGLQVLFLRPILGWVCSFHCPPNPGGKEMSLGPLSVRTTISYLELIIFIYVGLRYIPYYIFRNTLKFKLEYPTSSLKSEW